MTLDQAKELKSGDYVHHVEKKNRYVLLTIAKTYSQAIAIKNRYEGTSYKKIIIAREVA